MITSSGGSGSLGRGIATLDMVSASLAAVLRDRGAVAEPEALYRAALQRVERAGAPSWVRVAPIVTGYGRTLLAAGKPAEARPVLEQALGMMDGRRESRDALRTHGVAQQRLLRDAEAALAAATAPA